MGTGVLTTVPAPYVESGTALLPRVRRAYPLHRGGGCIFFDWAPLSGNAPPSRACAAVGDGFGYHWSALLLRREHHVWDSGEC
jgi:hypothetical protein